jgi:hypothetical protein
MKIDYAAKHIVRLGCLSCKELIYDLYYQPICGYSKKYMEDVARC